MAIIKSIVHDLIKCFQNTPVIFPKSSTPRSQHTQHVDFKSILQVTSFFPWSSFCKSIKINSTLRVPAVWGQQFISCGWLQRGEKWNNCQTLKRWSHLFDDPLEVRELVHQWWLGSDYQEIYSFRSWLSIPHSPIIDEFSYMLTLCLLVNWTGCKHREYCH